MKKLWASIALAAAVATSVSGCTIVDDPAAAKPSPDVTSESPAPNYPEATSDVDTRLVITVLNGNGLDVYTHKLFCSGITAVSPTDFSDANAACAVVEQSRGLLASTAKDTDDKKCKATDNQVIADVFGESKGEQIRVSFMRNNLCNAKVWDSLTPLIGLGN